MDINSNDNFTDGLPSLRLDQGAAIQILIPVTDAAGVPVNLTLLDDLCFTYGRQAGFPGDVTKRVSDGSPGSSPGSGCEIVTDPTEEHPGAVNNALLVTLTDEETRITPGDIYIFAVWALSDDSGLTLLAQGEMEIVGTVWC